MTRPPCAGKWALFDSTNLNDHVEARSLCRHCPMLNACRERLTEARRMARAGGNPEGTWAGQLLIGPAERAETEAIFSEAAARAAHAAHTRGLRDPVTVAGERVYQRRKKRAQEQRKRETAA